MQKIFKRPDVWLLLFLFPFLSYTQNLEDFSLASQPFVVFSPPKCGTHLIGKALTLLLDKTPTYCLEDLGSDENAVQLVEDATKNNSFIIAHNFTLPTLKTLIKKGYRVIFILRDPRDQLISMQDWLREGQWNWLAVAHITDPDEQLEELITGKLYGFRSYENCIKKRLQMLRNISKHCYIITRFEKLVGNEGLGSSDLQLKELYKIAHLIQVHLTQERALEISKHIFGDTRTFRHGQIGRWKERLLPYHKILFKFCYGQDLIHLGYEQDLNWN